MSLADALKGMRTAPEEVAPTPAPPVKPRPAVRHIATPIQRPAPAARQVKVAKSVDPEFEPVKIYIRKSTRKAASRKWEDADGGDFSELVEHLLAKYLGT